MKVRIAVEQSDKQQFIERIIRRYHFSAEEKDTLLEVYEKLRRYMSPYALYRINNRMRGVPLIDDGQAALVAMTLGEGVDRLQDYYDKAHALTESYMVECMASELLLQMYAEFNRCYPRFHRRYIKRYVFVGNELPLDTMQALLAELNGTKREAGAENEITANEYGVLLPSKSVVFFALLSENPGEQCEGICMNCENTECEYHRKPEGQVPALVQDTESVCTVEPQQQLNYGYQRIFGKR